MDALENLMTRRSIRAFTEDTVPAGGARADRRRRAVCAERHEQAALAVHGGTESGDARRARRRDPGRSGTGPDYHFYHANVLILASNERDNPHGVEDCACALENMFLAAHALGIGSVWINQFKGICDRPRVRGLLTRLHLPDTHIVLGCAALGYAAPAAPPALKKRNVVEWVL